ncbi:HAAS signaling domain-containing protein [Halobacillus karajensis]|uniref:Uncharacterized protein n=1 Tax=Halobacillus karajensis TaxID=195088 RepID=A0A024P8W5_9BACI|nr:hypothetical protein [Halobacillus karajensis]CDQ20079.1 hypothetical protein BN982_02393 [Halobacillus karajensis]CDQ25258.1 hypothetical protein BN983_03572 [Halobacillus karajensis]CDQ28381.1 hypothetical protein BN981_02680 [Halobacillus karajensis]
MEMIDRYIYAVTQKLPHSQRKDIAAELRGLIEDMLEERVQGGNITDKEVEEVLLELGNPSHLAQKYRGTKNYLIGPEFYYSYILVLKIALISTASVIFGVFIIQTIIDPVSILQHFIECIVSLVTALPSAFGWTTFGFAIADYYGGLNPKVLKTGNEWHPSKLPPIPDKNRQIKQYEPIINISVYTLLIAIFAFSNNYFGIWIFHEGFSGVVPFLNLEQYHSYLFLILIFGFGIIKECLKLVYGKWTIMLVTYMALVNLISLIAVLIMVNGPAFWNPNFMFELTQANLLTKGSEAYKTIRIIWEQSTLWILVLLAIGLVWDVVYGLIKVTKK